MVKCRANKRMKKFQTHARRGKRNFITPGKRGEKRKGCKLAVGPKEKLNRMLSWASANRKKV